MDSVSTNIHAFLQTATAKQNLELATDRDIWKAEAERMTSGYDAAQAELTALREELAELAELKAYATIPLRERCKRLAAAEQRNADVEARAADLIECLWGIELPGAGNPRLRKLRRALEALKPTESGASKQKICIECGQPYCLGVCVERGDEQEVPRYEQ